MQDIGAGAVGRGKLCDLQILLVDAVSHAQQGRST